MQLHPIENQDHPWAKLIDADPVRPHIPVHQRWSNNAHPLVLANGDQPVCVVCVSFTNHVPQGEHDLFDPLAACTSVAVLYTIWSLQPGSGAVMIDHVRSYIKSHHPEVHTVVTLSPLTEQARRFHTRNGARELRVNTDTVNFEYDLD